MLRTVGYVFVVLLIGTFAIAWSQQDPRKDGNRAETLAPDTFHLSAQALPTQEVNDMTFVYTNEQ